jgi:hypothetical protein
MVNRIKAAMRRPSVRAKMLRGLKKARRKVAA